MNLRHLAAPGYLLLCLALGGASAAGYMANAALQLIALPIIGWALYEWRDETRSSPVRALLLLTAGLIALCLVQLIPLPPMIWSALPGREPVVRGYELLRLPLPWLPLSLTPDRALASFLWLLPAIAVLLSIVILGAFRTRWLAAAVLAVVGVAVAVGALQLAGGSGYIYAITNRGAAVGLFANANHHATLLLTSIPFILALQARFGRRRQSQRSRPAIMILTYAAFGVVAVGLLTNGSLAGFGLSIPVVLASFLMIHRSASRRQGWLIGGAALLSAAAMALILFGPFSNNLFGEQHANADLSRQTSIARTLDAATEYLPFGSGVGSFLSVYRTREPVASTGRTYMNHAHSDWAELILETGVPGVLLAAAFLVWWWWRAVAIWRADEVDHIGRAAIVVSATIMAHSLVDYPLRTAAISALFAASVGLMAGVRPHVARKRLPRGPRQVALNL